MRVSVVGIRYFYGAAWAESVLARRNVNREDEILHIFSSFCLCKFFMPFLECSLLFWHAIQRLLQSFFQGVEACQIGGDSSLRLLKLRLRFHFDFNIVCEVYAKRVVSSGHAVSQMAMSHPRKSTYVESQSLLSPSPPAACWSLSR